MLSAAAAAISISAFLITHVKRAKFVCVCDEMDTVRFVPQLAETFEAVAGAMAVVVCEIRFAVRFKSESVEFNLKLTRHPVGRSLNSLASLLFFAGSRRPIIHVTHVNESSSLN
jgi:hypothetical protein